MKGNPRTAGDNDQVVAAAVGSAWAPHSRAIGDRSLPSPLWLCPFCSKARHQQGFKPCPWQGAGTSHSPCCQPLLSHQVTCSFPPSSQQLPVAPKLYSLTSTDALGSDDPRFPLFPAAYIRVPTIYAYTFPKLVPTQYPSGEPSIPSSADRNCQVDPETH